MKLNPQMQQIKALMHQFRYSQDPQLLQNIINQNPYLQNVMQMMQMNGMSMQQFATMLAQQRGIDINKLIYELQN